MRGIILAAGRGRRLEPALPGTPKCLITFGEKTLIQRQIAALRIAGINDAVIVVGYEKQQIIDHLAHEPGTCIYVENPLFDETNTIYSLWLARDYFNDGFFYFNADVLFDYRVVGRLCAVEGRSSLACIPGLCGEEEVKVVVDRGRITEIGKHIVKQQCFGEFVGVAKFDKSDTARFAAILDECIKDRATWRYFFEYAVNILARETDLAAVDIADLPATEIDFPQDLARARTEVFPQLAGREAANGEQDNAGCR